MHVIVITGNPTWDAQITAPDGYTLHHYTEQARYVTRLTDERAVLVLVDGDRDDWAFWTSTPKSNSATRRVPVIVTAASDAVRAAARASGADMALTPDDLLLNFSDIVQTHARVIDSEREKQLDCECQEPLPPLAVQGVEKFNAREFYPQHDLFEEQWVNTEGPVRDLYRAVLQVGVAYYQIERGNHRGALKMLLRAVQWLEALPDVCQTIDVAQLREDAYAVRAALEAMDPDDISTFDLSLLKPVQRVTT
jgi:hypothetical protein